MENFAGLISLASNLHLHELLGHPVLPQSEATARKLGLLGSYLPCYPFSLLSL
jgi:hypothetical protein